MPTPSSPAGDGNLIFGLLALQMDFLTREQLLNALSAWMLDKHTPLGDILRARGLLNDRRAALLEGMVAEHVAHHGNPRASLAALRVEPAVRQDLNRLDDDDVRHSLAAVPPTPTRGGAEDSLPVSPTVAHTGSPATEGVRYWRLREHAKGGLGEVFVALDEELKREVALKEIQDRHADHPDARARFLREAEVTGRLEHPSIVPVYGLGAYADGRPYYAMRFIKGDSLADAIAEFHSPGRRGRPQADRSLQLRRLLGRFLDVCQAVAYAHSRGVIHRDLKPANVMLGKFDETLVVDWGLAKVVGQSDSESSQGVLLSSDDSALTVAGQALGTPAYMSPEQASGKLDQLGPASDVYSLGATLYCLLTGQAPFPRGDVGVVLAKVQKGDFPPPRQVEPGVPATLEAVCLQAMARSPADRYASPRELAEEIEHWLADEPAWWPASRRCCSRRWRRRRSGDCW
jgi:serine/threonine-protein kinase